MEALKPCLRENCYICFQMVLGKNCSREAPKHSAQVFRFCPLAGNSMRTACLPCVFHASLQKILNKDTNLVILTSLDRKAIYL